MGPKRQANISGEDAIAAILKFVDDDEVLDVELEDDDINDDLDELVSDEGEKRKIYQV